MTLGPRRLFERPRPCRGTGSSSSRSLAWGWRQVGNDLNRHSGQECNPQTGKKIARGERQGLHPEGARQLWARERRETLSTTALGTIWAKTENGRSKNAASLSGAKT